MLVTFISWSLFYILSLQVVFLLLHSYKPLLFNELPCFFGWNKVDYFISHYTKEICTTILPSKI